MYPGTRLAGRACGRARTILLRLKQRGLARPKRTLAVVAAALAASWKEFWNSRAVQGMVALPLVQRGHHG